MGHIQDGHITDKNALVTNQELLGKAGRTSINMNQDEKFLLDALVCDTRCTYSPLEDGSVSLASRLPNTYASEAIDKESIEPTEY